MLIKKRKYGINLHPFLNEQIKYSLNWFYYTVGRFVSITSLLSRNNNSFLLTIEGNR